MNLNALKMGFANYLQELSETSNKEYNTSASSDVSIFMYANEFKNYISDELNVDSSILSKGINEILNMEVVNGKLVDPNEETTGDSFEIEDNAETDGAAKGDDGVVQDGAIPEEGAWPKDSSLIGSEEEGSEQTLLTDFLNELFEDETIKGLLDTDKSGELDEEEIGTFLDAIKGFDGDEENISLEDVIGALQAIQDDTFTLTPEEEPELEEIEETEQPQTAQQTGSVPSSGGGSYGGSGVSGNSNSAGVQEKTLDNMSKEELNAELNTAQSQLSEKQNVLNSLLDGSDSKLQSLQEAIDSSYDKYQEQLKLVDEDMAKEVDELKESIDAKQEEIDAKDMEIAKQESTVSDAETSYNNAVSSRENLEASLAALKSADTSNMSEDKASELNAKISELENNKIPEAEKAEEAAKKAWDDAKDNLEKLEEQREELETGKGGLNELNDKMTELEAAIAEKYPEVKEYMDAYNDAKEEYAEYKESAVSSAKADVQEAQKYVDEVNTAINNYDNKQTTKEYLIGDDLQAAIDWARKYDDMSQDQMRQVFADLGYQFDYDAWCADFVRMALGEAIGDENLPDWYRNCSNKAFCPTIQQCGEGHQISAEEAQPGDIVLYDWDGDGSADHVGLFVDNGDGSSTITAIEGNTSGAGGGSCVEEKSRNRGNIIGIYSMRK